MKLARKVAALVWEILREIGDERAYERHLEQHGRRASGDEWRRFSDERLRARYARPKCC